MTLYIYTGNYPYKGSEFYMIDDMMIIAVCKWAFIVQGASSVLLSMSIGTGVPNLFQSEGRIFRLRHFKGPQ